MFSEIIIAIPESIPRPIINVIKAAEIKKRSYSPKLSTESTEFINGIKRKLPTLLPAVASE